MNAVATSRTTGAARIDLAAPAGSSDTSGVSKAASLLPSPIVSANGIEEVYALMAKANAAESESQKGVMKAQYGAKKKALEEYKHQLAEEVKAEQEGTSLWEGLAKVGAVIGAACAIVASWGTATAVVVIVAIALSAAGSAISETKCFDEALGENVSAYIGAGCQIAGAVVGGCAGAASGVEATVTTVKTTGTVANSASAVASGAGSIHNAMLRKQADDALIGAKQAQNAMRRHQQTIEDCLVALNDLKDQKARGTQAVSELSQTVDETMVAATPGGKA